MPVELVSVFEDEFYTFYQTSLCNHPFERNLTIKNNEMDKELVIYFL